MTGPPSEIPDEYRSILESWWGEAQDVQEWNMDTEIFYDIGLTDDDLDELLDTLWKRYGIRLSFSYRHYIPSWYSIFDRNDIFSKLFKSVFGKRPFQSLTLGEIWTQIKQRRISGRSEYLGS